MRLERRRRGQKIVTVGPSTIVKEILMEDTCDVFCIFDFMKMDDVKKKAEQFGADALTREDKYGLDDYFVPYSLDKRKRWCIPDMIGDDIEELQDPRIQLRVSISLHKHDRNIKPLNQDERAAAVSYHDVSRDGKTIIHRESKTENGARLQNLEKPKGNGPRKKKGKARRTKIRERWTDNGDTCLDIEEDKQYQKIHIHYFSTVMTNNISLYNRSRRPTNKTEEVARPQRKNKKKDNKYNDYDDIYYLEEPSCSSPVIDNQDTTVDRLIDNNIFDFIVAKPVKKKRNPKMKFVKFNDDVMKFSSSLSIPSTSSGYQTHSDSEIEDDIVIIRDTVSPPITVTPLPIMFTTVDDFTIDLPSLPVYPQSWFIHKKNTKKLIGRQLQTCVVVKKFNDIQLFTVARCMQCDYEHQRIRIPPSTDLPKCKSINNLPEHCEICFEVIDMKSVNQNFHPFGLSCGHIFCTGCWISHISTSIGNNRYPAPCMVPDCDSTLSFPSASAILSSSSLLTYLIGLNEDLTEKQEIIVCPECKQLHSLTRNRSILCSCGISICTICSSINHRPLSCDTFQQYCLYVKHRGLLSLKSLTTSIHVIRNLLQCRTCSNFMQRDKGCNHMICPCGFEFCFNCGKRWSSEHYYCRKDKTKKVALMDVFASKNCSHLPPSLLTYSIEARSFLIENARDLTKRISKLPVKEKLKMQKIFITLSLYEEINYLHSRKDKYSMVIAQKIRFVLLRYFNTKDKNLKEKNRIIEKFYESIAFNC